MTFRIFFIRTFSEHNIARIVVLDLKTISPFLKLFDVTCVDPIIFFFVGSRLPSVSKRTVRTSSYAQRRLVPRAVRLQTASPKVTTVDNSVPLCRSIPYTSGDIPDTRRFLRDSFMPTTTSRVEERDSEPRDLRIRTLNLTFPAFRLADKSSANRDRVLADETITIQYVGIALDPGSLAFGTRSADRNNTTRKPSGRAGADPWAPRTERCAREERSRRLTQPNPRLNWPRNVGNSIGPATPVRRSSAVLGDIGDPNSGSVVARSVLRPRGLRYSACFQRQRPRRVSAKPLRNRPAPFTRWPLFTIREERTISRAVLGRSLRLAARPNRPLQTDYCSARTFNRKALRTDEVCPVRGPCRIGEVIITVYFHFSLGWAK